MALDGNCGCSSEQVDLMFKKAEQYIDDEIADRTYAMKRYWVDLFPVKNFPDGVGLTLDKVRFFGDIGPQYDGFDGWRKVEITRNAAQAALAGDHSGCGYNWEEIGHGMETVSYDLMQRDLRTKPICVKDIRTFWQYAQVQELIYQNLANISANMREQLNRNAALMYAVKYIALPNLPFNTQNPHQLPVIPAGVEVGKLNYQMMLMLYHPLVQEAASHALGVVSGNPVFGLVGHPETLYEMAMSDPAVRADLRECRSCDLISRYNFLDGMGPYVFMPDMYAPRYNRDAAGNLSRVFPFDRDIPIEIGTRPVTNPAYHSAEFELVLVMTKDLFALRSRKPLSSVGGATNFDAETGLFEWKWHNPERECDPYRRTGRYVTTGEIGIEPGDFTDTIAILVKRKPTYSGIQYWESEVCPPEASSCNNTLPEQGCPCPQIVGVCGTVLATDLVFTFDRTPGLIVGDRAEIETVNGSFISGEVMEVSTDGTKVRLRFGSAVEPIPGFFVGLRCVGVDYCSALVTKQTICGILSNQVALTLNRLLIARTLLPAPDTVTLIMCDGTVIEGSALVAVDTAKLEWTVTLTWAQYCAHGGVAAVCVPTSETYPNCPACSSSIVEPCAVPLCGTVLDDQGDPIPDVTFTITDSGAELLGEETTNANGEFSYGSLPLGTVYDLTPTAEGYTFEPAHIAGTLSASSTCVAFVATEVVQG